MLGVQSGIVGVLLQNLNECSEFLAYMRIETGDLFSEITVMPDLVHGITIVRYQRETVSH